MSARARQPDGRPSPERAGLLVLCALASVATVIALFTPWFDRYVYLGRPIPATSFTGFFPIPVRDAWNASRGTGAVILVGSVLTIVGVLLDVTSRSRSGPRLMIVGSFLAMAATILRAADPGVRPHFGGDEAPPLILTVGAFAIAVIVGWAQRWS